MASDDDAPTNLPHQSGALASMAAEHGGEGVSSGKPPLSKRRPVSLESSGYLRDPNAVEHDSHGSRVESTNSRHQLTSEVSAPAANKELGEKEDPLHPTGASGARLDFQSGFDTSTGSRNVSHSSFEHVTSTQRLYPQSRDGDDDAGSVYSYETVTMTTDSAFAWLSDHTDEPPELLDDHPILAFQDVALRVLIRTYQAWRQHGSWQNAPPGSAYRPESSRKRTRTDTGEDRDDEFGEGESSSMGVPGVSSKKRRTKEGALTFACPFFKKDPFSYKSCSKYVLSRIRDVKQHLGRGHQKPMYCPRCGQTFEDEDVRDEHLIAQGCEARPILKPEGITEPQKKQLSKKPPVNQSQEEQWFKIFDILFPGHMPRPESPYIESGMLGNVLSYHEFCTSRGPGIMANILTANNAVTWNLPFNELDVQAFQYRIFEQGFQELFSQWTGSGGLSAPGPDTVNLATRRMGRTAHLATPGPSRSTADFGDEGSEQQSVTTPSYFTTESSSHASSSMSWDGHTDWIAPPMGNVGGNALDPFDPMMTTADNEEIMRICRDMQNQNMRFG